ncbi:MAG: hypothetical protein WKF77_03805 [Planctomycetaceae bacterium]
MIRALPQAHKWSHPRQVKVESFAQRKQQRTPAAVADLDVVVE